MLKKRYIILISIIFIYSFIRKEECSYQCTMLPFMQEGLSGIIMFLLYILFLLFIFLILFILKINLNKKKVVFYSTIALMFILTIHLEKNLYDLRKTLNKEEIVLFDSKYLKIKDKKGLKNLIKEKMKVKKYSGAYIEYNTAKIIYNDGNKVTLRMLGDKNEEYMFCISPSYCSNLYKDKEIFKYLEFKKQERSFK